MKRLSLAARIAAGGAALLIVLLLVQCWSPSDPRSTDPAWQAQQPRYLAGLTAADGWQQAEGGVRWRWVKRLPAPGRKPTLADRVTVQYEGRLTDGSVFDSSYGRGEPATFELGSLIKGWQIAIPNMAVGETIEIAVPAPLGYGDSERPLIPANATLVFKVELLAIER